jgi:hypothetical protein
MPPVLVRLPLLPLQLPQKQRTRKPTLKKQPSFKLAVNTKLRFSNKPTRSATAVHGFESNLPLMERKESFTGIIYSMKWYGYLKNFKENVVGNINKLVK